MVIWMVELNSLWGVQAPIFTSDIEPSLDRAESNSNEQRVRRRWH